MRGIGGIGGVIGHFAAVTVTVLAGLMSACGGGSSAPTSTTPATAEGAGKTLHALFDREWEWRLQDWPLLATGIGDSRYDDRLPDVSLAAWKARAEKADGFLKELTAIDRNTLGPVDRINYDMFKSQLDDRRDGFTFDEHLMPLNADSGFHTDFALMPKQMAFANAADYDKYLSRLRAFPKYVDDQILLMREGLEKGMTIPRAALAGIESSIQPLIAGDPTKSPLWDPFARIPRDGRSGDARSPAERRADRDRQRRHARVSAVPDVHVEGIRPGRAHDARGVRAAEREGLLRVSRQALHDCRRDVGTGASDRARTGRRDPEGDGRGDEEERLQGHVPRVLEVPAHRSALLSEDRRRAAEGGVVHREAHGWQAADAVRQTSASALRRRAGARLSRAEIHRGPLFTQPSGRHRTGLLLGEHLRARTRARSTTSKR